MPSPKKKKRPSAKRPGMSKRLKRFKGRRVAQKTPMAAEGQERKQPPQGQTLSISADKVSRADILVQSLTGRSRSQVRAMFQHDLVSLNGAACPEPGTPLKSGDTIQVIFDAKRKYREKPRPFKTDLFKIVYEDNYILVVDKRAGLLTMKTEQLETASLIQAVSDYLQIKGGRSAGAALIHRLDRDTSGLLVLGKHHRLAQAVKEQFKEKKPERQYTAIVKGRVKNREGTFRSYLTTDENLNQYSVKDPDKGKLAVTHYKVVKYVKDCTVVEVRLETGRRNQIRVHFSEAGCPVVGDVRYKPARAAHPLWRWTRLALHAEKLGFVHPVTNKRLEFTSPQPREFEEFLRKLSRYHSSEEKNPRVRGK